MLSLTNLLPCRTMEWDYLSFRLWIGLWSGLILLILVAVDASALVCFITRFTEENFATLIAFIFIYKVSYFFSLKIKKRLIKLDITFSMCYYFFHSAYKYDSFYAM